MVEDEVAAMASHSRIPGALGLIAALILSSCINLSLPPIGKAGKYRVARSSLIKPGGRGLNEAIPLLEELAQRDPFYEDTLTLLGRAYYQQKRFSEALQIFQRAVVVNKEDEVGWLVLGMTQLQLGDDQKGLESFKGGLTLLNKVARHGYRGYYTYDRNGLVQSSIRRAIFSVNKDGLEKKNALIQSGEIILRRLDDEELFQRGDKAIEDRID